MNYAAVAVTLELSLQNRDTLENFVLRTATKRIKSETWRIKFVSNEGGKTFRLSYEIGWSPKAYRKLSACVEHAKMVGKSYLVSSEQEIQLSRFSVHWQATHEQRSHLKQTNKTFCSGKSVGKYHLNSHKFSLTVEANVLINLRATFWCLAVPLHYQHPDQRAISTIMWLCRLVWNLTPPSCNVQSTKLLRSGNTIRWRWIKFCVNQRPDLLPVHTCKGYPFHLLCEVIANTCNTIQPAWIRVISRYMSIVFVATMESWILCAATK